MGTLLNAGAEVALPNAQYTGFIICWRHLLVVISDASPLGSEALISPVASLACEHWRLRDI